VGLQDRSVTLSANFYIDGAPPWEEFEWSPHIQIVKLFSGRPAHGVRCDQRQPKTGLAISICRPRCRRLGQRIGSILSPRGRRVTSGLVFIHDIGGAMPRGRLPLRRKPAVLSRGCYFIYDQRRTSR